MLERTAPGTLAEVHLYHPQPHFEERHRARRQLTPAVLLAIHRALAPGGLPWWVTAIVWVLFLLVVGTSLATAQVGDGDDGG